MKQGPEYAKRIKKLYRQLLRKYGKPTAADLTEPLDQLLIGVLADGTSQSKAQAAYRKLCQHMVDLNDMRVTPPVELGELIGAQVPLARAKADRIVAALNAIRKRQNVLDLSFLVQRGRREAREYLESLEGVGRAASAGVVLYALGGHAIPVDDLTVYILRKEELVDASADAGEVQSFLERHVSAADGRAFADLLNRYVVSKSARVPIEKLRQLLGPPREKKVPTQAPASDASTSGKVAAAESAPVKSVEKPKKKAAHRSDSSKPSVAKSSASARPPKQGGKTKAKTSTSKVKPKR